MADGHSAQPNTSPATQSEKPSPKHTCEGHEGEIWSFVFLHDNEHIVSGSLDGTMRKWDCHTGLLVGEPWKGEGGNIWELALSPNGKMIACGRDQGSVQQWNTEGKMIEGLWNTERMIEGVRRHSNTVQSVSWSPNGGRIATGSYIGTILIRKADSGKVEMGPIETGQDSVYSLAYSPSGDRIASGGKATICMWDSNTGNLLVGPINGLGQSVTSVVWSSDSSKLYSASDKFARVFDSVSGTELHRFKHNDYLNSIALSSKHDVLACVGFEGIAQLWDTKTYQPLGKPLSPEDSRTLKCVSFSRDGRYLAYGGDDEKITLWMVEDFALQFALPASATQETLPEPAELSYLDVDATNPSARPDDMEHGQDDPYNGNFLLSSHSSLQSSSSGSPATFRGAFVAPSVLRTSAKKCMQLTKRLKLPFPIRLPRSPTTLLEVPAKNEPTEPQPDGKVRAREERDKDIQLPDRSSLLTGSSQINANSPFVRPAGGDIEDGHDNPHDNFQPLEFSHPFEALGSSRPSQLRNLPSPRSLWNVFIPSRHGPLADQTIPLQPRINRGVFSQHAGPQPVIVAAGRPRRFYWTVPRSLRPVVSSDENVHEQNGNAPVDQPSSTAAQPPHAATSYSTPQGPHDICAQPATRPPHEDEPDYGCWGNLWVCCIQHTRPPTVSISVSPIT